MNPAINAHLWSRRAMIAGGALALPGCASLAQSSPLAQTPQADRADAPTAPRLDLTAERLMRITVCLRPFRAAGPRIEAEQHGDKRIVHNYGHGGAGWSLSWGSAQRAAALALADGARDIAVIGAGAIGLTSALTLAQAGARVTIYADQLPPQTRSARATGTWSPDSRIALTDAAPAGFPAAWEAMTRGSFEAHQAYVGLAGAPVEWTERYVLSDLDAITARALGGSYAVQGFAALNAQVRDLTPPFRPRDTAQFVEHGVREFQVGDARDEGTGLVGIVIGRGGPDHEIDRSRHGIESRGAEKGHRPRHVRGRGDEKETIVSENRGKLAGVVLRVA